MLIIERTITGYNILDTHEKLVNLDPEEKEIQGRSGDRI
jgi:hypothetical protein